MRIILVLLALSLTGCAAIQGLINTPTPANISTYVAELEVSVKTLNQEAILLLPKMSKTTASTVNLIIVGMNGATAEAEKDVVAGDNNAALLAYNTAKAAYDQVNTALGN